MQPLSAIASIRALQTYANSFGFNERIEGQPQRKSLNAPQDDGSFVRPFKQSVVKNPRLMPGTRIVLMLLAGWAGHGGPIETTLGIIGKHVSRSARQVQRYLKDAMEEGYLRTSYVKDRIGRIIGLRVHLARVAIFHNPGPARKAADPVATTSVSTNKRTKSITNCWEGWLSAQAASRRTSSSSKVPVLDSLAAKGRKLLAELESNQTQSQVAPTTLSERRS